jgi:hypothetical protein
MENNKTPEHSIPSVRGSHLTSSDYSSPQITTRVVCRPIGDTRLTEGALSTEILDQSCLIDTVLGELDRLSEFDRRHAIPEVTTNRLTSLRDESQTAMKGP